MQLEFNMPIGNGKQQQVDDELLQNGVRSEYHVTVAAA